MIDRSRPRRAFTLLEMLAATAMVALLAGSLYASLHIAFKARRSALSAVETVRKRHLALALLKADLQAAVVPGGLLAGDFVGLRGGAPDTGSDELSFYAVATDAGPRTGVGDIKKVEYTCVPSDDRRSMVLIRRLTANLLAPATPAPREEVVCREVQAFTCRYYDGSAWQDAWDSTAQDNVLPTAVEVTLELADGPDGPGGRTCQVVPIPAGQGADNTASSGGTS